MQYDITIDELINHPQYIPTIVEWLYNEWGNNNRIFWESWITSSTQVYDIPKTYILFVNNNVVGTYSLWRCDLQSRQDLFPWFGGLYVDSNYRGRYYNGKKLGEILQCHAISELKRLHYTDAYLFTSKSTEYYNRNGWENFCDAPNENSEWVHICHITIR